MGWWHYTNGCVFFLRRTELSEREQLGDDPKLTSACTRRGRLELSIALARGKALMIDAARDKLAGITVQRRESSVVL
jgi:hypothetical protein